LISTKEEAVNVTLPGGRYVGTAVIALPVVGASVAINFCKAKTIKHVIIQTYQTNIVIFI
jgi:hypothetical protein